jgi:hypothetical protein
VALISGLTTISSTPTVSGLVLAALVLAATLVVPEELAEADVEVELELPHALSATIAAVAPASAMTGRKGRRKRRMGVVPCS